MNGWDLTCEYLDSPLGITNTAPRFSWRPRGAASPPPPQQAYCIDVHQSSGECVWNTGWIADSNSFAIPYKGEPLKSAEKYRWSVKLRLLGCPSSVHLGSGVFETGIFQEEEWKAHWISHPNPIRGIAPLIRRDFYLKKKPEKSRLYFSGLGYARVAINGTPVDASLLDPGWTDYDKTVLYRVWDVTDLLTLGQNVLSVELGEGWHGLDHKGFFRLVNKLPSWLDYPKMLCRLVMDDEVIVSSSDGSWFASSGGVRQNSLYQGELYDARLEKPGWRELGYEMAPEEWLPVALAARPKGVLRSQVMSPIGEFHRTNPVYIDYPDSGENTFVVDFGVNMAGWAELRFKGLTGLRVTVRYAEVRNADGSVNQNNLRSAESQDTYIFANEREAIWAPRFTYHGFRYIQVDHDPGVVFFGVVAIQVHSLLSRTGDFSCSNGFVNDIYRAVLQTERSNLHSVPTDCPQRDERLGWLNDATVRCEETIVNFDASLFFEKWLQDIVDAQDTQTGAIPDTAPYFFGTLPASHPSSALVLIPWYLYLYTGDLAPARKHYHAIRKYVHFKLRRRNEAGLLPDQLGFGEWAAPMTVSQLGWGQNAVPANISHGMLMTAYLYYDCLVCARLSFVLGERKDFEYFSARADEIRVAINRTYLKEEGFYANNAQAENVFALFLDIVPTESRSGVLASFLHSLREENDWHITTGNQMTKYLFEVLGREGLENDAWRVISSKTYPSIGFMLVNGATTIWERWENLCAKHMNSHNHPMLGACTVWFQKYLLGIRQVWTEEEGLYTMIEPCFPEGLEMANGRLPTPYGTVSCAWQMTEKGPIAEIDIPWNARVRVNLLSQSGWRILKLDGLPPRSEDNLWLTSGKHIANYVRCEQGH